MQTIYGPLSADLEIRLFGLRRFGNHAIINWLIPQFKGNVCHINDAKPASCLMYAGTSQIEGFEKKSQLAKNRFSVVIVSYENYNLKEEYPIFDINHKRYKTILLLRDPYNTLASLLHNHMAIENRKYRVPMYNLKNLWLQYAREYLGKTNYLGDSIKISFNEWFQDKEYRMMISAWLGLDYNESGLNRVSNFGGGSSFDKLKFNGKAQHMKVLSRWPQYRTDPKMVELINNPRIRNISKHIFGDILNGKDCS